MTKGISTPWLTLYSAQRAQNYLWNHSGAAPWGSEKTTFNCRGRYLNWDKALHTWVAGYASWPGGFRTVPNGCRTSEKHGCCKYSCLICVRHSFGLQQYQNSNWKLILGIIYMLLFFVFLSSFLFAPVNIKKMVNERTNVLKKLERR